jgi:hypothetical protein
MPSISLFPNATTWDEQAFRENSRQLEEFRTKDFSSMESELNHVIVHGGAQERYIPLVWRVCRDLAVQYVKRPMRVFTGGTQTRRNALQDIYRRLKVDAFLLRMQQRLIAQNTQIVSFDFNGPGSERLMAWSPYEADVWFDDPLEEDIRRASRVELLVPIKRVSGTLHYGKRVYTQTEAWSEVQGQRVPLFGDSIAHGFGQVPLAEVRRGEAIKGFYFPALAEDLLAVQIGLNIALSDIELICRTQCFGREALTGSGALVAAEQMQNGPDFMRIYPADAEYTYTETSPAVDKYTKAAQFMLDMVTSMNYVPTDLARSTGITGAAKMMERHDLEEERERSEGMMADFEQDLADLMTMVLSRSRGSLMSFSDGVDVKMDYRYVQPRSNDLQKSQSREIDFAQGVDSVEEYVARTQGLSLDDAKSLVVERLESFVARRGVVGIADETTDGLDNNAPTAGLDRTARAVG